MTGPYLGDVAHAFMADLLAASTASFDTTAATATVVTSAAGKKIYVVQYNVVVGAAENVNLEDDTGTVILGKQPFAANSGIALPGCLEAPIAITAAGKALVIRQSVSGTQMGGSVAYFQF
jgi:hypothetical protein